MALELVLVAALLDRKLLPFEIADFLEEVLELNAYLALFFAAVSLRATLPGEGSVRLRAAQPAP